MYNSNRDRTIEDTYVQKTIMPELPGTWMQYSISQFQGIGKRENQEDALSVLVLEDDTDSPEEGILAVVADGMGGMNDGEWASKNVIEAIESKIKKIHPGSINDQIKQAVRSASDSIYSRYRGRSGSTVVVGVFYRCMLSCVSVGDSYIFLFRDRQLSRINISQTVRTKEYRKCIGSGNVFEFFPNVNINPDALYNCVGVDNLTEFDEFVRPLQLQAGDTILFCSDGVVGCLTEEEISDSLCYESTKAISRSLAEKIVLKNMNYQDNYTGIVIQCRV